jgi:DNA primase
VPELSELNGRKPTGYDYANGIFENKVFSEGVSIVKVVRDYAGIDIPNRGGLVRCPFHDDNTPSFSINPIKNTFTCFAQSCKSSGTPINFVMKQKDVTAEAAMKDLCERYGFEYTVSNIPVVTGYHDYVKVYNEVANICFAMNQHVDLADSYWGHRGIPEEIVKNYQLGYFPKVLTAKGRVINFKQYIYTKFSNLEPDVIDTYGLFDRNGDFFFAGRYIIPIRDLRGNVVAFAGRAKDKDEAHKYINTADNFVFHKHEHLFNIDRALVKGFVYVVEGYFDALSLISSGIPNVVATMGASFSDTHLKLLKNKEVIFAFDNDKVGIESQMNMIKKFLPDNPRAFVYSGFRTRKSQDIEDLSMFKDLSEALVFGGNLTRISYRTHTIPGCIFVARTLRKVLDLGHPDDQRKYYDELVEMSKVIHPVYKSHFKEILIHTFKRKK